MFEAMRARSTEEVKNALMKLKAAHSMTTMEG